MNSGGEIEKWMASIGGDERLSRGGRDGKRRPGSVTAEADRAFYRRPVLDVAPPESEVFTMKPSTARIRALLPVLALAVGACNLLEPPTDEPHVVEGTLFIAQQQPSGLVMDALYQGRVTRDAQGCLRLDIEPDRHTVVWPYGFTLREQGGELHVRDASGRDLGAVGGSFELGGGEVAELHGGLALSAEARAAAESRCPGRFWIVGGVPD